MTVTKKKIWLFGGIALLLVLVLLLVPPLLLWLLNTPPQMPQYQFADPALSTDIYADTVYMGYDRSIYYVSGDSGYQETEAIRDVATYAKEVQLLVSLVQAAIAGDADAYNECFSPEYLAKHGDKTGFTMQKIYGIYITKYASSGEVVTPDGYQTVAFYGLSYKIKDNNGSLRDDMDSDGSREQYFSIVTDDHARAWIYDLRTQHYIAAR